MAFRGFLNDANIGIKNNKSFNFCLVNIKSRQQLLYIHRQWAEVEHWGSSRYFQRQWAEVEHWGSRDLWGWNRFFPLLVSEEEHWGSSNPIV